MKKLILFSIKGTTFSLIVILIMTGCLAFNIRDNYNRLKYGVSRGVYLEGTLLEKMLEHEVYAYVLSLNQDNFTKPRNAYLDFSTGTTLPEVCGKKIDVRATVQLIMEAEPYTCHDPVYVVLDPEITVDLYRGINKKIGSFMTGFGGGNRGENIRLAAYLINNTPVAPGEVFSFNRKTTPRKLDKRDYGLAPIIVGDSIVPGYGGGICQVATTLYNAVKNADLEIVERHPHSMPVDYVPRGMDATVSYHLDFKFRNNRDNFIMVKTSCWGYRLVVEIWE
ncbi:MAG TPA: VanW family protein [Firmicutes bacterium]|jgi:vancomycin resistance protein YoaR|nr:VanW family protein [Bacillota bacterium]